MSKFNIEFCKQFSAEKLRAIYKDCTEKELNELILTVHGEKPAEPEKPKKKALKNERNYSGIERGWLSIEQSKG